MFQARPQGCEDLEVYSVVLYVEGFDRLKTMLEDFS